MIKIIRSSLDIICSGTFVLYSVGALANGITPDSVPNANLINVPTVIEAADSSSFVHYTQIDTVEGMIALMPPIETSVIPL